MIFFYVPFALLFVVMRDLDWSPRRLHAVLRVLVVLAVAFVAVGFVEYATRQPAAEPEGHRLQPVRAVLPRQLAVLRPEHLRALPGGRDDLPRGRAAVGAAPRAWSRRWWPSSPPLWGGLVLTLSQSSFAALLCGLLLLAALRFGWRTVARRARGARGGGGRVLLAFSSTLRRGLQRRAARFGDLGPLRARSAAASSCPRAPARGPRRRLVRGASTTGAPSSAGRAATSASHTIRSRSRPSRGSWPLVYLALPSSALRQLLHGATGYPSARRSGRLRRHRGPHLGVRVLPRGPADLGAAGGRHRARPAARPPAGHGR